MKYILLALILGGFVMFTGCKNHSLEHYSETSPKMDIQKYFTGPIKAWGIVQDWKGRVSSQFDIEMVGTWEGDVGTLTEHFKFYDGKTQDRVWTIRKIADGKYEGTAHDILDKASGATNGNAARWTYVMDLPVGDSVYRIKFDDWMFLMNDGVLINRSYLRKFGLTVSELTIFMQKQPSP